MLRHAHMNHGQNNSLPPKDMRNLVSPFVLLGHMLSAVRIVQHSGWTKPFHTSW